MIPRRHRVTEGGHRVTLLIIELKPHVPNSPRQRVDRFSIVRQNLDWQ